MLCVKRIKAPVLQGMKKDDQGDSSQAFWEVERQCEIPMQADKQSGISRCKNWFLPWSDVSVVPF